MKINATLVKEDGLYGMVMPEAPDIICFTDHLDRQQKLICKDPRKYGCTCALWDASVQAMKDAAIRYEDQEAMNKMLYFALPDESIKDYKAKPGIYPLPEPLEVEPIWQIQKLSHDQWQDHDPEKHIAIDRISPRRQVLRISQGTDDKCPNCGKSWDTKKHNACECGATIKGTDNNDGTNVIKTLADMYGPSAFQHHLATNSAHGYTEGSEPICLHRWPKDFDSDGRKRCQLCGIIAGVEEKKEPETPKQIALSNLECRKCKTLTVHLFSDLTLACRTCGMNHDVKQFNIHPKPIIEYHGVSEREEPTTADCEEIENCLLNSNESALGIKSPGQAYLIARRLKHYFHITRRA